MSDSHNLVPEGYYAAVAVPTADEDGNVCVARLARSKNGVAKVLAAFELLDAGEYTGRRLFWDGYFTKDSGRRTTESLRFMGFKGQDLMDLENQALDQRVSVKVEHNEWEDKVYARVAFVNREGGASIRVANPMSLDDKRKFAAMMKASVAGVGEVDGQRVDRDAPDAGAGKQVQGPNAAATPNGKGNPAPAEDPWATWGDTGQGGSEDEIPF